MSRRTRFVLLAFIAYMTLIFVFVGKAFDDLVAGSPLCGMWFLAAAVLAGRMAQMLGRWMRMENRSYRP